MPTYQYRCKDCDTDLEVVQKFTDATLTECPNCDNGELRKIYNAVGVVFKGSGFYRTDSRDAKSNTAKGSQTKQNSAESGSGSGGTTKSDSTSPSGATTSSAGTGSSAGSTSTNKAAATA